MRTFAYTARDGQGNSVTGTLMANSVAEIGQMLRNDGKYPITVRPVDDVTLPADTRVTSGMGIRISRAELIQFSTQLAIMAETGVTLSEALECAAAQAIKPHVKALLNDLCRQVQAGNDFSFALGRHPRTFPRLYVTLIKASEKSGMLSRLIGRATAYLRDEQETLRRVKGALTYPAIMLAFAMSTTVFLLAFVLPKFTAIYAQKAAALPMPTRVLMGLSDFLVGNALLLVFGTAAVGVFGYFFFRTNFGARVWYYLQLRIPLIGPVFRKLHLARGLRMLGTMSGAGVNLVECVNTARDLCDNVYYRELWTEVAEQIQSGKQLSDPMFTNSLVPRSIAQMLHAAEKGGKLGSVMEQVAGFSELELKETIAELTKYIEPVMILVMGLIIGGVAMALLLPIFTISRVMAAG